MLVSASNRDQISLQEIQSKIHRTFRPKILFSLVSGRPGKSGPMDGIGSPALGRSTERKQTHLVRGSTDLLAPILGSPHFGNQPVLGVQIRTLVTFWAWTTLVASEQFPHFVWLPSPQPESSQDPLIRFCSISIIGQLGELTNPRK